MFENEIFTRLVHLAPDAMIVVDETGTIQFANAQVEALFGYSPEEIKGQKVERLIPERFREAHVGHRSQFAQCPKTRPMGANLELAGLKKSGEEFPVEISLGPMQVGTMMLATAAIRDISEKKHKEKKLIAANADLERFVYIASHDLQEPLRSIQQLLQILEEKLESRLDEEDSKLILRIMNASIRMSTLIEDLLGYSRLGRQKELRYVDCNTLLEEINANLGALIESTGAQIIIKKKLPTLQAFVVEFKLLFQNLIDNAIKFRKGGETPVVTIDADQGEADWIFSISDNGIGIEEKFIDKLFVVFQRLHNRDEYPGNGIGLAHCKKIIEIHGGEIWIESQYGKGTTVWFTIPRNPKVFL